MMILMIDVYLIYYQIIINLNYNFSFKINDYYLL